MCSQKKGDKAGEWWCSGVCTEDKMSGFAESGAFHSELHCAVSQTCVFWKNAREFRRPQTVWGSSHKGPGALCNRGLSSSVQGKSKCATKAKTIYREFCTFISHLYFSTPTSIHSQHPYSVSL